MSPMGPPTRPMTTTKAPLSTRAITAVRATPMARLDSPAAADPAAKSPQAAAETGPMRAPASVSPPASSASRTGMSVSKAIMPTDQNTSTRTTHSRTREVPSRRSPSMTTTGACRADRRAPRNPLASTWVLGSLTNTTMATRCTRKRTRAHQ